MHPLAVATARPKQWVKNVLVFAAPGAAGVLDQAHELGRTLLAFVAFCLAASGTYFWNDILDVEADRAHPTKRRRPIASRRGRRSAAAAAWSAPLLPIVAFGRWPVSPGSWQTVAVRRRPTS